MNKKNRRETKEKKMDETAAGSVTRHRGGNATGDAAGEFLPVSSSFLRIISGFSKVLIQNR